jgi:hypothetical protein
MVFELEVDGLESKVGGESGEEFLMPDNTGIISSSNSSSSAALLPSLELRSNSGNTTAAKSIL